jgi:hypothetical protein
VDLPYGVILPPSPRRLPQHLDGNTLLQHVRKATIGVSEDEIDSIQQAIEAVVAAPSVEGCLVYKT